MPMSSVEPLYESVAARLRERIHAGVMGAGERVPSLRAMSRQHGVSIGTVVQAYQQLERQGVIVARPQSGYYVSEVELPSIELTRARSAPRARPLSRNLLDQVIAVYARDDLIPLHMATPSPSLLPTARVSAISRDLYKRIPDRLSGYVPAPGLPALRQQIARRLNLAGLEIVADDVVITAGALEAITLSLQILTQPGDAVLVEGPTYYGLLQAIAARGLKVVEIPVCCDDGLDVEYALKALETHTVRAAVLIPSFSNPSGALLSRSTRQVLARACNRMHVPIIENDVYGDLAFDGTRPEPMKCFDMSDHTILCGSASKAIAPGLRIGWAVSRRWSEDLIRAKSFTSWSAASLSQYVCAEMLSGANMERPLRRLRGELAANIGRFRSAIAQFWPEGTCVSQPKGGLVLWVKLPSGSDGQKLFELATDNGIGIVPGTLFSASGNHRDCVRLSAAIAWEPAIAAALQRLGELAADAQS